VKTRVKLQVAKIRGELPAELSNHQLHKVQNTPWSNLAMNSLRVPVSVLLFSRIVN